MSRAFFVVVPFLCLVCAACSGSGAPSGGEGTDGGIVPSPSGTSTSPPPSDRPTPAPLVGCHQSCKCYEPPYHPDEIDCRAACTKLAGWTSDNICAYFAGTEGVADCERRCDGIRATWSQPNIATIMASQIFGCATLSSSCEATKSCVQAYTDQQKTVCP
jgi:hypothetical protein